MKKSKKKLKGMTLIEMIISIFIFALMGGLLILIGTHIDNTTKATNRLKNKIVVESPYAANHVKKIGVDKSGADINLPSTELDIVVEQDDISGKYYYQEKDTVTGKMVTKEAEYKKGDKVEMKADKYGTEDLVTDGMTPDQIKEFREGVNGGLNLEFIDIQPAAPATPLAPTPGGGP